MTFRNGKYTSQGGQSERPRERGSFDRNKFIRRIMEDSKKAEEDPSEYLTRNDLTTLPIASTFFGLVWIG